MSKKDQPQDSDNKDQDQDKEVLPSTLLPKPPKEKKIFKGSSNPPEKEKKLKDSEER